MAVTAVVPKAVKEGDLLAYLQAELAANRWLHPGGQGSFFVTRDRGFGHSRVSMAAAESHRMFYIHTSDSARLSLARKTSVDVAVEFNIQDADWAGVLEGHAEAAVPREPVLVWYEVNRDGQPVWNGIFYAVT